jgi:hypothetical protein
MWPARLSITERTDTWLRLTQPVMIQSFVDEFDLPTDGTAPNIPAETGQVLLSKGEKANMMLIDRQKKFRSGTGKLLHMMRWSRPEILDAVRECSTIAFRSKMMPIVALSASHRS